MAGTRSGGKAAALTNKKKYGESFYARVGKLGGLVKGRPGGFGAGEEGRALARIAGARGGSLSRRKPSDTPRAKASQKARTKPCTYCDRPGHTSYFCEMRLQALARNKANKLRQDEITDDYAKMSRLAAKYK